MKEFWDKLTKSQRYYLMVGGFFVALFVVFQFVIFPLWDSRERIRQGIRVHEKALGEMSTLGAEYGVLKRRTEAVQQAIAARPQNFTLFSYLEKKADETGLKSHIKSINPIKGMISGPYEEAIAEMRLDAITMKQFTDFLYGIESSRDYVRVSKIAISKMKENPDYLTATLQVLTYLPLKPADQQGGSAQPRPGKPA